MRINNNLMAMNTHRQLGIGNSNGAKSMEKLSSGFRINRAGDDAAGLSISEKMRGQIRGLNQASRNAQDGISLIQTAEGALNESQAILQRMRELAVQSSNDTNVGIDREAIQNEIKQLNSELDRIGNTTEFNTQKLLKGDGGVSLTGTGIASTQGTIGDQTSGGVKGATNHTQATQTVTFIAQTGANLEASKFEVEIQGQKLTVNFKVDNSLTGTDAIKVDKDSVTSNSITILVKGNATGENGTSTAVAEGLTEIFKQNDVLSGNFTATSAAGAATLVITAQTKELGGEYYGSKGYIAGNADQTMTAAAVNANVGATTHTQATHKMDFTGITSKTDAEALIGQGITIGDKQYEFYNANAGAYTGEAIGLNISAVIDATANWDQALATAVAAQVKDDSFTVVAGTGADAGKAIFTATALGEDGNGTVKFADGGIQKDFKASFQIGANQSQTMEVKIGDMRSEALGIKDIDLSTRTGAEAAITTINSAIEKVSAQRSELGAFQNRLEHTIKNLDTSSENLQASESRIRDVDMAKEMMEFTKNNILQQAAQAMLAQANQAPQGVLQLLR